VNLTGASIASSFPGAANSLRTRLSPRRGTTGESRQVKGAKKVATLNIGGSGTTSVSFVVGVDNPGRER
jgi:acetyl-CoA C-acetyltransferase